MVHVIPVICFCQDYIPTLTEGKRWNLTVVYAEGQIDNEYYNIACDSTINGTEYHTIIREDNNSIIGFVREDVTERKVYYKKNAIAPEDLIIDYSLESGDSFFINGYYIVADNITMEMLFGEMRRVIHFGNNFRHWPCPMLCWQTE